MSPELASQLSATDDPLPTPCDSITLFSNSVKSLEGTFSPWDRKSQKIVLSSQPLPGGRPIRVGAVWRLPSAILVGGETGTAQSDGGHAPSRDASLVHKPETTNPRKRGRAIRRNVAGSANRTRGEKMVHEVGGDGGRGKKKFGEPLAGRLDEILRGNFQFDSVVGASDLRDVLLG
uniref:Uncharacterized protein n=1 Tax=Craspedostauros australis TaxID=1486917 RepID=A0A7R9WUU0_9STRA